MKSKTLLAIGLCAVLGGCSGGDGSSSPSVDSEDAALPNDAGDDSTKNIIDNAVQGVYEGTISRTEGNERALTFFWLPDGTYVGATRDAVHTGNTVFASSTEFEITIKEYVMPGFILDGQLRGAFADDGSVTESIYQNGQLIGSISASRLAGSNADFSLENIIGTYTEPDGVYSYSIDGNGDLSGNDAECNYSGTIADVPDSAIFTLKLDISGCVAPSTSLNGQYDGVVALDFSDTAKIWMIVWNDFAAFRKVISR